MLFEDSRPCARAHFSLDDVDAVTLGRTLTSPTEGLSRTGVERRLVLEIDDKRMSRVHAHLRATHEGWLVEDAGSKNGTRLNGVRIDRAILKSTDLLELGRSFLLFRQTGIHQPSGPTSELPFGLATANPSLARLFGRLVQVSRSRIPILVQGETGTGKELVARAIHQMSGRAGPFRAVNCGALPPSLLESEFFGYRKGAFSGATEDRIGLIRSADKGTLFLDEIGDLSAEGQTALLRTLQEGEVQPIGAVAPIAIDVRVVAATHRNLARLTEQGRFREDLLARLSGFALALPALRHRREDLGALVHSIVARLAPEQKSVQLSPEAIRAICTYAWPSNIRQLEKAVLTGLLLADGKPIDREHLPDWVNTKVATEQPLQGANSDRPATSRDLLEAILSRHRGNVTAAAAELRTSRIQVHRLCDRFGVDLQYYRSLPLEGVPIGTGVPAGTPRRRPNT